MENGKDYFGIVPEIQYDLISRIIPGFVLFTAIFLYFKPFPLSKEILSASLAPTTAISALVIMVSWAIGICLSGLGHALCCLVIKREWKSALKNISLEGPEKSQDDMLKNFAKMYGVAFSEKRTLDWHVKLLTNMVEILKRTAEDKHTPRMLTKIAAESGFGGNLCAASIAWFVIVLLKCFYKGWDYFSKMQFPKDILAEQYIVPVCSFAFIIFLFWVMLHRSTRYIQKVIACHLASEKAKNRPSP